MCERISYETYLSKKVFIILFIVEIELASYDILLYWTFREIKPPEENA